MGTTFNYDNNLFTTALIGKHQAQNAALGIETLKQIQSGITNKIINNGISSVVWPGRIQEIETGLYYDVAHNESGVRYLLDTLKNIYPNKNFVGLMGLKGDKDIEWLPNAICNHFKTLFITADKEELLLNPQVLANNLDNYGINTDVVKSVADGITNLRDHIRSGYIGIIFGSHYIAKEIFEYFEISFDSIYN